MTMPRRLLATALIPLLALVVSACDDERRAISRDDLPALSAEPALTVELSQDGFTPDTAEVRTTDVVRFDVIDGDYGIRTEDDRINTGILYAGESTDIVFPEPGVYTLFELDDDASTMTVTVTE